MPAPQSQSYVVFRSFGVPEVLEVVEEASLPTPGRGEARIRVEASSVSYTDTLIRRGLYPDLKQKPPVIPGYDVVGVVDAVGEGVEEVRPGDRVADLVMIGGNARYLVRPAAGLARVPAEVDAAEAVGLVLSWLTAWQALKRVAGLRAGERLLVIGGNGAVGQAAIALARRVGAEVYATASASHHEVLRAAGAVPLPRESWQAAIREQGGVDVVLDGVCADGYRSPYRALRKGGRLVAIGFTAPAARRFPYPPIAAAFAFLGLTKILPDGRRAEFYGINGLRASDPGAFREDLGELMAWLARGEIAVGRIERIGLRQVAEAHARLEAGGLAGRAVVVFDGT